MLLLNGDCIEEMQKLIDDGVSVDSVVTDPPYHLTSIVERFGKEGSAPAQHGTDGAFARASKGFMGKEWDGGDIAFRKETWELAYKVLKPGGHLLAFSGSRTYHRMAVAIEDAGFDIRDQIMWLYGSGFPKSLNIGKAIDKKLGNDREVVGTIERGSVEKAIEKGVGYTADPANQNNKAIFGAGSDLSIYHNGTNSYIDNDYGHLSIRTNVASDVGSNIYIQPHDNEDGIVVVHDGNVELYYDGSKKFETVSTGAKVTGDFQFGGTTTLWDDSENAFRLGDNNKVEFGNSDDLQIYHDSGGDSYIQEKGPGVLYITATQTILQNNDTSENLAKFIENGAVELYYDGAKKFETTSTGVTVTGTVSDSKGNLRSIPQNTQGSAYTLVAADAGKHILASGTVTIPNSVFAAGDAVTIINNTSGDLTLTASVGTLYNTADAATGNRTLATRGMATILFTSPTAAYISGAGLS